MSDIDLGKASTPRKPLAEFAACQDIQGTRRAYLAETMELTYKGGNKHGELGIALGSQAQVHRHN
jgi:hypothetical protein